VFRTDREGTWSRVPLPHGCQSARTFSVAAERRFASLSPTLSAGWLKGATIGQPTPSCPSQRRADRHDQQHHRHSPPLLERLVERDRRRATSSNREDQHNHQIDERVLL
jgi:hypothetical protein